MTKDLPDPAMVDELSPEAQRLLTQLTKGMAPKHTATTP
jgi:hypothetical protein